ncbi:tetraspanin-1-like isoform X2 [Hypomesus transpacificus]|uniref:tetraspanin-1-like isoform X2 n=1 Tax=Hypomesus transpacificus TaxID=137520 RepID=UPI001F07BBAA|nr:tetraspanin-1-like isoform X2 [Hypomesus transpacificus]XP_046871473.1 tetraspanin-1-like isoform X2 [Hypomesus transpacificus]
MCCKGFLKVMMFVFNFCIFAAGATILGVGVWVKVDSGSLLGVLNDIKDAPSELAQLANVGYLLIAIGAVLVVMGFLGCCGAIRESRCMLLMFFIIVLIIFIAEVAGAVIILVFQPVFQKLLDELSSKVIGSIREDYGKEEGLTALWNSTMTQLKCCGYRNYTDFDGSPFLSSTGNIYPETCCNSTSLTCNEGTAAMSEIDGCFEKLVDLIEHNAVVLGAVALGIAALEIAAMVVSMVLYTDIGNK